MGMAKARSPRGREFCAGAEMNPQLWYPGRGRLLLVVQSAELSYCEQDPQSAREEEEHEAECAQRSACEVAVKIGRE